MISLEYMKVDLDWQQAFECSSGESISLDDVFEITHAVAGAHDEESWLCVGLLGDGRWFMLEAGCCYSGWDCQGSGTLRAANDYAYLVRYCLTASARSRLGIVLQDELA